MNDDQIEQELLKTLDLINDRLEELSKEALKYGTKVGHMKDKMGRFMANDMIVAKANILSALVTLRKNHG